MSPEKLDIRDRLALVHAAFDEYYHSKENPFEPTPDIDVVWVVSQPGTVKTASKDGVYEGVSNDIKVVRYGIELVRQITAQRLSKPVAEVTKDDIRGHGPTLFYNGEDATTANYVYTQNEDFEEMTQQPSFPIPRSKIVIDHIDGLGTHTQVVGFASYLKHAGPVRKVAVVSMVHHAVRVGRYLERYKELFPAETLLLNAAVDEDHKPVGKVIREVIKVAKYVDSGDMAKEPLSTFEYKKDD